MIYGQPLPERLNRFKNLLANTQQNAVSKWDVPSGNGSSLHDVFNVSIELPKYRLYNTRTLSLQDQYIYSNSVSADFFTDSESDEIQSIQHDFLKGLITSPDKEKDLLNFFKTASQTEPFILTNDGFVISGNRRLCALRELVTQDQEKYRHFTEIRVVILPSLDPKQIDQIEDLLEQQTNIKEDFSWINRALGYRRRIKEYHFSDEKLASIAKVKKAEIRGLIDKLDIVERYLEEIGQPKNYKQIEGDFQAFDKIYVCQGKDNGFPVKKVAFEKLAFIAIKNKNKILDSMYHNISTIHTIQSKIQDEIAVEFKTEIEKIKPKVSLGNGGMEFSLPMDPIVPILKQIEKPENEKRITEIISDNIDEYLALQLDKKKKTGVLERVRRANTLLIEANSIKSHEANKEGIKEQLNNIESELNKLRVWAKLV